MHVAGLPGPCGMELNSTSVGARHGCRRVKNWTNEWVGMNMQLNCKIVLLGHLTSSSVIVAVNITGLMS